MGAHQKHYLKINPYLDIISGIAVVLSFSDGIIKIIGREGSGKSVLTQLLAAELLEEDQEVVIFSDIPHSEQELHDPISQQLHLKLEPNSDFYEVLNRHIQARPFDQQKLILVFDDAEQIPDDCFAAIRHLFEKNYHDRPEVSMVFAGSELLDQKLNEPENRTFNKNIILNFEVRPMNRSELEAFCNAYLVEMGLQQKHRLSSEDLDNIFAETQGLPGKIPELIFAILDREEEMKKIAKAEPEEKTLIKKLVVVDDDPEPELAGLSVEDREEVLTAFKDQVPWRWQSNGVGFAVVVLFLVVSYGYFVPEENRGDSIVIFPPPTTVPGQLSREELAQTMADTLSQQPAAILQPPARSPEPPADTPPPAAVDTPAIAAVTEPEPAPVAAEAPEAPAVTGETEAEPAPEAVAASEPEPEPAPEPAVAETEPEPVPAPVIAEAAPDPAPEPVTAEPEPVVTEPEIPAPVEVAEAEPAPAPAPTIAETPRIVPASTPPAAPATDSRTFVGDWLAAWENQDAAAYLDAYHSAFTPPGGMSLQAWREDRRERISSPGDIDITQESLEVINASNTEATVRVRFTYATPTYSDRTVKELTLAAENGDWAIREERNISVETLTATSPQTPAARVTPVSLTASDDESGFEARIRQVIGMANPPSAQQLDTPFGMFINDWLDAWKSQDLEGYFRHYRDEFQPARFDSLSDWRADRIRKINEKRFIEIAFDQFEVLDEDAGSARVRFWLSYASSFYLDRTLKEVVITTGRNGRDLGIVQERNLEVEIIPFYP